MEKNDTRQKKILVPTEFGEGMEHTLHVACKIAAMHDAEIVLLHVNELPMPMAEFFTSENLVEKRKNLAVERLSVLTEQYKSQNVKMSWLVMEGKPYRNILKACDEMMAEMIVMGIMGKHGKDYGMLGSNVHKVIRKAKCPVVTVTDGVPPIDAGRIIIAVDPEFGIHELRSLLQKYHTVYNPVVDLVCVAHKDNVDDCEIYLGKQEIALHKQGIKNVQTTVINSFSISNALLDHIAVTDADMIWMETHGRKGISSFFMGSVTEDVLVNSPIPVLSLHPEREPSSTGSYYYHSNLPI